jgi:hypothetical protein
MSAPESEGLTTADWLRYGFLLFLGSLLWLAMFGKREGGVASLFALYLIVAAGVLLAARTRGDRS